MRSLVDPSSSSRIVRTCLIAILGFLAISADGSSQKWLNIYDGDRSWRAFACSKRLTLRARRRAGGASIPR